VFVINQNDLVKMFALSYKKRFKPMLALFGEQNK
jgi:hypothetical protein